MKKFFILLLLFAVPCSAGIIMRGSGGSSTSNILSKVLGSEDNGDSLSVGSGTLTSSGVTHTTNHSGTADGAFTSIGSGDTLYIQSTDNLAGDIGSASLWYKRTSAPDSYLNYWAYDNGNDQTNDNYFKCLRFNSTTKTRVYINNTSYEFTTSNFEDGSWHHLAWTWNHTTNEIKMFVDDTQQGSTQTITNSAPTISSSRIYIGNSPESDGNILTNYIDTIIFTDDENYE